MSYSLKVPTPRQMKRHWNSFLSYELADWARDIHETERVKASKLLKLAIKYEKEG